MNAYNSEPPSKLRMRLNFRKRPSRWCGWTCKDHYYQVYGRQNVVLPFFHKRSFFWTLFFRVGQGALGGCFSLFCFLDVFLTRLKSNSQSTTHPNPPNPSTPHHHYHHN